MLISLVDGSRDFEKWRVNGERVYDANPEARFFLSWIWFSMWLSPRRRPWFFLAAKPRQDSAEYAAFFPLKARTGTYKDGRSFSELAMAGSRVSDYTGFICDPAYQDEAIPALAMAVNKTERLPVVQTVIQTVLTDALKGGFLFLPIPMRAGQPVGMLASLIDQQKRAFLFFIAARDETENSIPSGLVLHAYSIRFAIQHGFATCDFLRGNEPYKYSFGAIDRQIRHIVIERIAAQSASDEQ